MHKPNSQHFESSLLLSGGENTCVKVKTPVFSPKDKSRLLLKRGFCLCLVTMGKVLKNISNVSHMRFYLCTVIFVLFWIHIVMNFSKFKSDWMLMQSVM